MKMKKFINNPENLTDELLPPTGTSSTAARRT